MGASRDDFTKYPRTPHLFGSTGTPDDKHLSEADSLRSQRLTLLKQQLEDAIRTEAYESAARLRDEIKALDQSGTS